ncbi:MAG: hypothetical protein JXA00_03360 [Candidatus Thermoplasmatota archaeon]|nr:hypothetical protein [Candidatus Thermoplasmatota archaeon]
MGKEQLIPLCALLVLLTGSVSSMYVYTTQLPTESVEVNGQMYTLDQLFSLVQPREFPNLNYSGIAFDDLIITAGVSDPGHHQYTLVGADGYEKTVTWENLRNGLLTAEGKAVFTDLPKAFRVDDIVRIEVM